MFLLNLITVGLVDTVDLTDPGMGLDIIDLEASPLFENGDLDNYISAHQVFLYDILETIYLGDLVTWGLVNVNDLIIRNSGSLASFVDEGLLDKNDFTNKTLSASALNASGIASTADLNIHDLIAGGNVLLHSLLDSGLVSLVMLIDEGFVSATDLASTVTGRDQEDVLDSDVIDRALIEENSLITGVDNDQVILNGSGSLLSTGIAELIELVRTVVVDQSYLICSHD